MLLPLLDQENYDSYSIAAQRIVELEEAQKYIAEDAANEALAILAGEDEAV
jgi:translation elongation factor P/translation initiation factor 5A